MMEADSVHAQLEKMFKSAIVYTPSDYVYLMRQARPQQPYHVKVLDYNFFSNFEQMPSNVTSIRPGTKAGEATVNEIRGLTYDNGEILYKLRQSDAWIVLQKRIAPRRGVVHVFPVPLYSEPIKISKDKFNHLQELKSLLPPDYHGFYDVLPHD